MNRNTRALVTVVTVAIHAVALAACGAQPRTVVVPPPAAVPQPGDDDAPAAVVGPASITLLAVGGGQTMAYALQLDIDDVNALPLDEPVEAGPATSVHLLEIGNGEIPYIDEALCARLDYPSPACDREVLLYEVAPPRELTGVLTLYSRVDVLSGLVDAELADDESARGEFSIDID